MIVKSTNLNIIDSLLITSYIRKRNKILYIGLSKFIAEDHEEDSNRRGKCYRGTITINYLL